MARSELPQPSPDDFPGAEISIQEVGRHPNRNPVRGSKRWGLGFVLGVGLSLFIACSPNAKDITVSPTNEPAAITTTAVACDPEQFAKKMDVPTPYPRGMEGAPENITAIQKRIGQCLATEQDRKDMLAFNAKVEAAATAGAATTQAKQIPTATPEATKAPEVKKCLVLDNCSKVEFFVKPNAAGVDVLFAGANLEPGTLLYARRDGQRGAIDLSESSPFKGTNITVRDPNLNDPEGVDYIIGDIIPVNPKSLVKDYNSINVAKGNVIGEIGNSGVKNDGYNFIHYIGKLDPQTGEAITGVGELKQAYGYTPGQPIKRVLADAIIPQSPFTPGPPVYK